ncbi:MAG: AAA family ATPase [Thiotrichaceae bacterium]
MQLLRVRVPNFRALKDVDLTFEKDFVPQIFPLGSLNGGGKSTLLQLIFILLHRPNQSDYIKNILDYITPDGNETATLATLDILDDDGEIITLEFECKNRQQGGFGDRHTDTLKFFRMIYHNNKELYRRTRASQARVIIESMNESFFSTLGCKIFLAAPSSQIYLFLPPEQRKSLFKVDGNYNNALDQAKKSLQGFFTYDTFSVATLSSFFRTAWDKDIDEKVTTGKYGDNYSQMLHDMNQILAGKTIVPQLINTSQGSRPLEKDLIDSIVFKAADGQEIYPEDLSHGELKKLSIYAWLKANQIKNSIVLMDEIENGFHPDWQFQIVKELEAWEPSNQYILATHSYELCTALTPSHVKELEPKLVSTPK